MYILGEVNVCMQENIVTVILVHWFHYMLYVCLYCQFKLTCALSSCNNLTMLLLLLFFVHVYHTVSVFMFDYVSTIISYSLIGIAVFTGKYDGLDPAGVASAISKVNMNMFVKCI